MALEDLYIQTSIACKFLEGEWEDLYNSQPPVLTKAAQSKLANARLVRSGHTPNATLDAAVREVEFAQPSKACAALLMEERDAIDRIMSGPEYRRFTYAFERSIERSRFRD